jgi:hypothetical protein
LCYAEGTLDTQDVRHAPSEDDVFEITTTRTEDGCISYVDSVLAHIAKELMELRDIERECKRQIRLLEDRQHRRLAKLNALGSIVAYPTQQQRQFIATLENAVKLRLPEMVRVAYEMCVGIDAHKSNWRSEHDEPLPVYVSRVLAAMDDETAERMLAVLGTDETARESP